MSSLPFRTATVLATTLPLLLCEATGYARTTGATLTDEVQTEEASQNARDSGTSEAIPTGALGSWLNVNGIRMCRVPKHPRDGIPASIHACPLAFASRD